MMYRMVDEDEDEGISLTLESVQPYMLEFGVRPFHPPLRSLHFLLLTSLVHPVLPPSNSLHRHYESEHGGGGGLKPKAG